MTIDLTDIREAGKLIPLQDALDIISTTEPMASTTFSLDGSDKVEFDLPMEWNSEEAKIREQDADYETLCTVRINDSSPFNLTKEAILSMTSSIGLTKDYVMRTPGPFIKPQLNWWVKHWGVKNAEGVRMLHKGSTGVAFVKSSILTFPNLPLVEAIIEKMGEHFNTDEFMVDYKIAHSLERTALRIIVPVTSRTLDTPRHTEDRPDDWALGLQFTNSLMGHPETRLNLSGYLFSYYCTNGSISEHATSGNYNRKIQGQDFEDVLEWVSASTTEICASLAPELETVESMTQVSLEGQLNDVMNDVFKQMKVPVPARKHVVEALIDSADRTAYGLMNAVTEAANDPAMSDRVAEKTMRVGGLIPLTIEDRCESCHRVNLGGSHNHATKEVAA